MRFAALVAGAILLAAGAAYAATSLLDYASGSTDPVGRLSPRGDIGGTTTATTGEDRPKEHHKEKRKRTTTADETSTAPVQAPVTTVSQAPATTVSPEAPAETGTTDHHYDDGKEHGGGQDD